MLVSPQLSKEVDALLFKLSKDMPELTRRVETLAPKVLEDTGNLEIIIKTKDLDLLVRHEIDKGRI